MTESPIGNTTLLPVLPVLIPLVAAALSLLAWRSLAIQRMLGIAGAVGLLASAVALLVEVERGPILVLQVGGWPAPFGISFVVDRFGAVMTVLAGIVGVATFVFSLGSVDARRQRLLYHPLLCVLLAGVCGAFLTGDLFNLYVWFEVLLMSSFALLALGGGVLQVEGAIKYVTLNLLSSALFLIATGLVYGALGTLNMADIALKVRAGDSPEAVVAVSVLLMTAFGIKAAAFPLFFWLPASYHTPPFAVSAIFAGLLTKVGVYALVRSFTLMFVADAGFTHTILLVAAGLTMAVGVLGAAAQREFRKVLSFHIVSQIGYMIMGLALFTPLAIAGTIFYVIHHIVVKANLFFIAGVADRLRGTSSLVRPGRISLYAKAPFVSALFVVAAFSLAGMPPLSGFFAKFVLLKAGVEAESWAIVVTAAAVGLLTLFSMTKIWAEAFWKGPDASEAPTETARPPRPPARGMIATCTALAAITVLIGVFAGPVFEFSERAAAQLLDGEQYIRAVLGDEALAQLEVDLEADPESTEAAPPLRLADTRSDMEVSK